MAASGIHALNMNPFVSPRLTYSRLLPPIERGFSYALMERLGLSMCSDTTRIPGIARTPVPVAYTYFGQFIIHDLTRDDTALFPIPIPEPEEVVNHRAPFLDLDSVYGRGPCSEDCFLYERDGLHLKVGESAEGLPVFDIPLDRTGHALVGDDRNNENILVRQVLAILLKLHNLAVDELHGTVPVDKLFETARERVRWQYQWLVRNDYLARICKPEIYDDVIRKGNTRIDWGDCFAIPVEFSHAAGRFGHSMVREEYRLNGHHPELKVEELFQKAQELRPLTPDLAADWNHLTGLDPAHSIDTTVVAALFHLFPPSPKPNPPGPTPPEPESLPVRTLFRGVTMRIPTGETVRAALDPAAQLCIPPDYDPFRDLSDLGLIGRTPLWYYILLEAEVCEQGARLGNLGSRLFAEVIHGALRYDPGSIAKKLADDPNWRPPRWRAAPEKDIDSFRELAALVGLATWP